MASPRRFSERIDALGGALAYYAHSPRRICRWAVSWQDCQRLLAVCQSSPSMLRDGISSKQYWVARLRIRDRSRRSLCGW